MLTFLIILIVLDLVALYLIWNRIDGVEQLAFIIGFCERKTFVESVICVVVVMLYLVFTIPYNVIQLFKKQ